MKQFLRVLFMITMGVFLSTNMVFATSWAYPFVVWDDHTYEVVDESITNIVEEIGEVTRYSDMETYSGNFSNAYPKGTKYYSIHGVSTEEAIAVEISEGEYKKAVRKGEFQADKRDVYPLIQTVIISVVAIIAIAVIIAIVITLKRKHN
ncbi:hypothetical protein [Gracilibacillus thailandensis]|uniref:Uncharacterized protein n=1 Tax=Gracilibacillus thailandensis TaxID=563735 RepID=A0A6N7QSP7_9BACI|nr:hypothetical protein [Gracilibacillus thailandensis]MRI65028.1 hypothetical protein [Gracilibacillus thailandensis]